MGEAVGNNATLEQLLREENARLREQSASAHGGAMAHALVARHDDRAAQGLVRDAAQGILQGVGEVEEGTMKLPGYTWHPVLLPSDLVAHLRKSSKARKWTQGYLVQFALQEFFARDERNARRLKALKGKR